MRRSLFVLAATVFVIGAASSAGAQSRDTLSPLEIAVACAPPPTVDGAPDGAPRIIGSQDTVPRSLFANRDLLVIDRGTDAGVELGQQYFVRRAITFGSSRTTRGVKTLGWMRVVAVNGSTAIVLVDHVCAGIVVGDYLEPFAAPVVSADVERDEAIGQPDFTTLGHIIAGNEDRYVVGAGDFVLIDWGEAQGLSSGARFSIYRDVGVNGLPLVSIGEGVVISTGSTMALSRVTRTRDAIYSGDYIALRR